MITYSSILATSLPNINLVEAWGKALVPASIISDFKCTGIYPFKPQVVLEKCSPSGTPSVTVTDNSESCGDENANESSGEEEDGLDFTTVEEKKFQQRFEEGYNLYDPKY